MKEKCTKYEALFKFRDEKELEEHIKTCPDCQKEQAKMEKISSLIQEVKPYYIKKRKDSFGRMKVACVLGLGLFAGVILGHFAPQIVTPTNSNSYDFSSSSYSSVNEYGMPIDSYGLITVN